MTDDLEDMEFNLEATHSGSAKKIRAGRKNLARVNQRFANRALWKKQLSHTRKVSVTLAGRKAEET